MTAATLMLMAAVGASAASGTFGSAKALHSFLTALSPNWATHTAAHKSDDGDKNDKHECKGDGDDHENGTPGHENGTPGHENNPCDDDEGDGGHGGGD